MHVCIMRDTARQIYLHKITGITYKIGITRSRDPGISNSGIPGLAKRAGIAISSAEQPCWRYRQASRPGAGALSGRNRHKGAEFSRRRDTVRRTPKGEEDADLAGES